VNIYKDKTIKDDERSMILIISTACFIILLAVLILTLFEIVNWKFLLGTYIFLSSLYTGLQFKVASETKFEFSKNNFFLIAWGWPYTGFIVIKHFALYIFKKGGINEIK